MLPVEVFTYDRHNKDGRTDNLTKEIPLNPEIARLVLIRKIRQAIDGLNAISEVDLQNALGNIVVELANAARKAGALQG